MSGAYADELSEIGLALAAGGDILVYGCHFGQGALGRQAASRLASLTGADIAASDDLTGNQTLGGDWELEYHAGNVETAVAVSTEVQQNWSGVLPTWWNAQWQNRTKITFDNTGSTGNLTNFPVLVSVSTAANVDFAKIEPGGTDIRFVDDDDATPLAYEIEKWDDGAETATVWVKVPQIVSSNTDFIYIYYNNPSAGDGQNPSGVWDINHVGVWHMDENGAGVADEFVDSSGTSNHGEGGSGTAGKVPTQITTGKIGNAQTFDNTDDHVNIANFNASCSPSGSTGS